MNQEQTGKSLNVRQLTAAIDAASKGRDDDDLGKIVQFLVFEAGKGHFGINILETHEILKPVTVTRLPNVESDVLGVINLRGNIIPVIDVNKKFSGRYTQLAAPSRIVVSTFGGKYMGLLVDRVVEVARISEGSIEGAEIRGFSNQFVRGVGRSESRLFLILNLDILIQAHRAKEAAKA